MQARFALCLLWSLLLGGATAPQAALAQEYPVRPLHLVVPYAPGAGTDLMARAAAQKLALNLGQPIVVDSRPGGDTLIGTRAVLSAPPDGYTLLLATTTTAIAPAVHPDAGYRLDNLELAIPLAFDGFILSVNSAVPAKTLGEFIAYARANPGKLNLGSLGSAGPIALITDRFRDESGLSMEKINYSGSGPALKDLAGGVIQVIVAGPVGSLPLMKSGHIRALAYTAGERNPIAPDVPTFKELGHPSIVGGVWYAMAVPAKVPDTIKQKLVREGAGIRFSADFREKLADQGSTPWLGTLADFTAFVRSDLSLWEADIKRGNVKADQ